VWHAADLFTSLPDNIQETFGLVILEAMACGLPVVASDWDGFRDLVLHDQTGLLVPTAMLAGATRQATARLVLEEINYDHFVAEISEATVVDPTAAAAAYRLLLTDPARRRAMSEASRRRALEKFTWARIIHQYETLWSEQAALRLEFQKHGNAQTAPGGPALYPEPERSFRVYPTLVFDGAGRVAALPHCLERLDTFLSTPLTHHVAER